MNIELCKPARKFLEKCDDKKRVRIMGGILNLPKGDVIPLQGSSIGAKRLRIGGVRVIYHYEGDSIIITHIDNRGDVY